MLLFTETQFLELYLKHGIPARSHMHILVFLKLIDAFDREFLFPLLDFSI